MYFKKIFFIFIFIIIFLYVIAEEYYIRDNDTIYKITVIDNDTIKKEIINIIDIEKNNKTIAKDYDEQLLKKSIPYKWQIGAFGLWQGSYYGVAISNGILPDNMPNREQIIFFSSLAMPFIMFLTPPLVLNDSIEPIAIPIIDWGYRVGPIDYFALRFLSNNRDPDKYDMLYSALIGYAESWGGYYLLKSLGTFKRAAGHFYYAGALLGYSWGILQGISIINTFGDNWDDGSKMSIVSGTGILYSYALRSLGFYMGNNYRWRSFDSWIIAINTIPGMLYAFELDNYIEDTNHSIMPLITSIGGITSSVLTGYLLRNTHFDDGNALLLMLGGALGAMVGSGINIFFEKFHPSTIATTMILAELSVYFLRKNTLNNSTTDNSMGFIILPKYNGFDASLSLSF